MMRLHGNAYFDTGFEFEGQVIVVDHHPLEQLPNDMQRAAVDLFLKGKTYEEVGKDIGYSPGGLWVKIRREIQKINDKL